MGLVARGARGGRLAVLLRSYDDEPAAATLWYRRDGETPVPFHFEDALRSDAGAVVSELRRAGYAVELLSGDTVAAAGAAAAATGIDTVHGGVRPDGKIARLDALKAQGHKVLMIGDGLNDAPALAAGHASISPASAADISQTAAGTIFQGERLTPVIETIKVAQAARRMSLQNFAIALAYNALFVPLAMAGLVTPLLAALAMSFSSIAVTGNALRLRTMRLLCAPQHRLPATRHDGARLAHSGCPVSRPARLAAFLWALRSGQFEDLEGASWRAIADSERPGPPRANDESQGNAQRPEHPAR